MLESLSYKILNIQEMVKSQKEFESNICHAVQEKQIVEVIGNLKLENI